MVLASAHVSQWMKQVMYWEANTEDQEDLEKTPLTQLNKITRLQDLKDIGMNTEKTGVDV